jgi:putative membrane protein
MKESLVVFAGLLLATASVYAQGVNDAQIASIVVTANQVDIDAGQLAHAASTNTDVKKLAQLMIDDHAGVNQSATALVTRLKVTPEDNPTRQSLKSEGENIDAMDKTLIPDAKNAERKALLVKVRPAFIAHLAHANDLQSTLSK